MDHWLGGRRNLVDDGDHHPFHTSPNPRVYKVHGTPNFFPNSKIWAQIFFPTWKLGPLGKPSKKKKKKYEREICVSFPPFLWGKKKGLWLAKLPTEGGLELFCWLLGQSEALFFPHKNGGKLTQISLLVIFKFGFFGLLPFKGGTKKKENFKNNSFSLAC